MKTGIELIADERQRQVTAEGWTAEHDDEHNGGELADAAACYADAASAIARGADPIELHDPGEGGSQYDGLHGNLQWPWEESWLKLSPDPVRNLVKAGALIAAEIDRLQRQGHNTMSLADATCGARLERRVMHHEPRKRNMEWQPIETAPKSVADGSRVDGIYLLGFLPDDDLVDESAMIDVIWWEPLLPNNRGGRGKWCANRCGEAVEVCATHWMPLPPPPSEA